MKKGKFGWLMVTILLMLVACGNGKVNQENGGLQDSVIVENTDYEGSVDNLDQSQMESGVVHVITSQQFVNLVTDIDNPKGFQYKGSMPCIVDFYADWCGPCHRLNPVLQDMAKKYKNQIMIYKVNVDKSTDVADVFKINSIPTLIFFSVNKQPNMIVGAPVPEDLEKAIQNLLLK